MGATILHIGADPAQHALVRRLLHEAGYSVVPLMTVPEALVRPAEPPPDLILLDLEEEGGAGLAAATRLRSRAAYAQVPLVILGAAERREAVVSLGCDGLVEKPIDPSRFLRRVSRYMKGRKERVSSRTQRRHLEAYTRDLVERLESKVRELTHANDRLRRSDAVKNRVLENVSHELAMPLTPLVGYVALLESGRLGPLTPLQRRTVMALGHNLRRLASTVDQLLDLAVLEEVGAPLESAQVDLVDVARNVRRILAPKARSRRVQVDLVSEEETVLAEGDAEHLRQAVAHLVDHGIRFSPRGGYVLIEVRGGKHVPEVAVYDSGKPVAPEDQALLFEPFAGQGRACPDGPAAPILALALARRIARAHGGELDVESPPRAHPESEHDYPGLRLRFRLPGR